jgi:hypothetical protein
VIAHYSGPNAGPDCYQVFMERTRFIRRNNFEIGDRAFSFFGYTNSLNDFFSMRVMTSFLRHNLFVLGPFYQCFIDDKSKIHYTNISEEIYSQRLEEFARKANQLKKKNLGTSRKKYRPIGYDELLEASRSESNKR